MMETEKHSWMYKLLIVQTQICDIMKTIWHLSFKNAKSHADLHEWHGFVMNWANFHFRIKSLELKYAFTLFQIHFIDGINSFSEHRWNSAFRLYPRYYANVSYRWGYYCFEIFMEIMIRSAQRKKAKISILSGTDCIQMYSSVSNSLKFGFRNRYP